MKHVIRKEPDSVQMKKHKMKLGEISLDEMFGTHEEQEPIRAMMSLCMKLGAAVAVFDMCPVCGQDQEGIEDRKGTQYVFWMEGALQVFFVGFVCDDCSQKTRDPKTQNIIVSTILNAYKGDELDKFLYVLDSE